MVTTYFGRIGSTCVRNAQQLFACEEFLPREDVELPPSLHSLPGELQNVIQDTITLNGYMCEDDSFATERQLQTFADYITNAPIPAFQTKLQHYLHLEGFTSIATLTSSLKEEHLKHVFNRIVLQSILTAAIEKKPELFSSIRDSVDLISDALEKQDVYPKQIITDLISFLDAAARTTDRTNVLYETYGLKVDDQESSRHTTAQITGFSKILAPSELLFLEHANTLIFDLNSFGDSQIPIKPTKWALKQQVRDLLSKSGLDITEGELYVRTRVSFSDNSHSTIAHAIGREVLSLVSSYINTKISPRSGVLASQIVEKLPIHDLLQKEIYKLALARVFETPLEGGSSSALTRSGHFTHGPVIPRRALQESIPRAHHEGLKLLLTLEANLNTTCNDIEFYHHVSQSDEFRKEYTAQVQRQFSLSDQQMFCIPYIAHLVAKRVFNRAAEVYLDDLIFPKHLMTEKAKEEQETLWNTVKHASVHSISIAQSVAAPLPQTPTGLEQGLPAVIGILYNFTFREQPRREHPALPILAGPSSYLESGSRHSELDEEDGSPIAHSILPHEVPLRRLSSSPIDEGDLPFDHRAPITPVFEHQSERPQTPAAIPAPEPDDEGEHPSASFAPASPSKKPKDEGEHPSAPLPAPTPRDASTYPEAGELSLGVTRDSFPKSTTSSTTNAQKVEERIPTPIIETDDEGEHPTASFAPRSPSKKPKDEGEHPSAPLPAPTPRDASTYPEAGELSLGVTRDSFPKSTTSSTTNAQKVEERVPTPISETDDEGEHPSAPLPAPTPRDEGEHPSASLSSPKLVDEGEHPSAAPAPLTTASSDGFASPSLEFESDEETRPTPAPVPTNESNDIRKRPPPIKTPVTEHPAASPTELPQSISSGEVHKAGAIQTEKVDTIPETEAGGGDFDLL